MGTEKGEGKGKGEGGRKGKGEGERPYAPLSQIPDYATASTRLFATDRRCRLGNRKGRRYRGLLHKSLVPTIVPKVTRFSIKYTDRPLFEKCFLRNGNWNERSPPPSCTWREDLAQVETRFINVSLHNVCIRTVQHLQIVCLLWSLRNS